MIAPEDIKAIINALPYILKFFIPGAIFLKVFSFIYKEKKDDYKYFIFKSVILSGIIVYPITIVTKIQKDFVIFTISILISIVFGWICGKVVLSSYTQEALRILGIRKTTKDFLEDVIDMSNGSFIELHLKNDKNIYLGTVEYFDEKDGKIYVSIRYFSIQTETGDLIKQDSDARMVFCLDNTNKIILKSKK